MKPKQKHLLYIIRLFPLYIEFFSFPCPSSNQFFYHKNCQQKAHQKPVICALFELQIDVEVSRNRLLGLLNIVISISYLQCSQVNTSLILNFSVTKLVSNETLQKTHTRIKIFCNRVKLVSSFPKKGLTWERKLEILMGQFGDQKHFKNSKGNTISYKRHHKKETNFLCFKDNYNWRVKQEILFSSSC